MTLSNNHCQRRLSDGPGMNSPTALDTLWLGARRFCDAVRLPASMVGRQGNLNLMQDMGPPMYTA